MSVTTKVENPGPCPEPLTAEKRRKVDWAMVRSLAVGEAVDVSSDVKISTMSVGLTKLHRRYQARWTRRGHRIWRVQ